MKPDFSYIEFRLKTMQRVANRLEAQIPVFLQTAFGVVEGQVASRNKHHETQATQEMQDIDDLVFALGGMEAVISFEEKKIAIRKISNEVLSEMLGISEEELANSSVPEDQKRTGSDVWIQNAKVTHNGQITEYDWLCLRISSVLAMKAS